VVKDLQAKSKFNTEQTASNTAEAYLALALPLAEHEAQVLVERPIYPVELRPLFARVAINFMSKKLPIFGLLSGRYQNITEKSWREQSW
jgi:hypothetical protein